MPQIKSYDVLDVRFPTSLSQAGSDAMNPDGDHSAAYVVLHTDDALLQGFGLTFTIGRGTDLCVAAARQYAEYLVGRDVDEMARDMGGLYRALASDSQLRWLGPEKGVVHMSMSAVLNAAWDLVARRAGLPLWQLVVEMEPEELLRVADLRYLGDVLDLEVTLERLRSNVPSRGERIAELRKHGYPAYTTSPGWLGYDDTTLRRLCRLAVQDGYQHIKLKVGASLEDDVRRCSIAREELGPDRHLMLDANQVWDVPGAVAWVEALQRFRPLWIEEPTSPDDILGHAAIRRAVAPIGVATGEHVHNRIMFKQLLQAEAIDYCQIDSCRLGSVNEVIAVLLLAAQFGVPICPHAGGVGLCELVQHLSIIDYVAISGGLEGRVIEYVDHLHEHFQDPCEVVEAAYMVPVAPGYGPRITDDAIQRYSFPSGEYWQGVLEPAAV